MFAPSPTSKGDKMIYLSFEQHEQKLKNAYTFAIKMLKSANKSKLSAKKSAAFKMLNRVRAAFRMLAVRKVVGYFYELKNKIKKETSESLKFYYISLLKKEKKALDCLGLIPYDDHVLNANTGKILKTYTVF